MCAAGYVRRMLHDNLNTKRDERAKRSEYIRHIRENKRKIKKASRPEHTNVRDSSFCTSQWPRVRFRFAYFAKQQFDADGGKRGNVRDFVYCVGVFCIAADRFLCVLIDNGEGFLLCVVCLM